MPNGRVENCAVLNGFLLCDDYFGLLASYNEGIIIHCKSYGTVLGRYHTGGIVGGNAGSIIDSEFQGYVSAETSSCGGLCAGNGGIIENCFSMAHVESPRHVGGLAGINASKISRSFFGGQVVGEQYVGGLAGENRSSGNIENCFSTDSVSGSAFVGGLIGLNEGVLSNCYSAGSVSGVSSYGGLVGSNDTGTISRCFWDVEASGPVENTGGVGKTGEEMRMRSTFTNVGWDFVGEAGNGVKDVWRMCLDGVGYPRLSWEYSGGGDFDCPDGVGMEDLVYLCGRWLMEGDLAGAADSNGDGVVGMADLGVLVEEWVGR